MTPPGPGRDGVPAGDGVPGVLLRTAGARGVGVGRGVPGWGPYGARRVRERDAPSPSICMVVRGFEPQAEGTTEGTTEGTASPQGTVSLEFCCAPLVRGEWGSGGGTRLGPLRGPACPGKGRSLPGSLYGCEGVRTSGGRNDGRNDGRDGVPAGDGVPGGMARRFRVGVSVDKGEGSIPVISTNGACLMRF
jgi:hypothetical protein